MQHTVSHYPADLIVRCENKSVKQMQRPPSGGSHYRLLPSVCLSVPFGLINPEAKVVEG